MKNSKWFILAMLAMPLGAFAQSSGSGNVGGGEPMTGAMQDMIYELDRYLLSPEGLEQFKDDIEQPQFHNLIMRVKPVVKDERVIDSFGVEQACVSHADEHYFQCDLKRLPKLELENQPDLYRIVFHELLFQAGLELPISKEIPSDFRISAKLSLAKRPTVKYVPVAPVELNSGLTDLGGLLIIKNKLNVTAFEEGSKFDEMSVIYSRDLTVQIPWPFDQSTAEATRKKLEASFDVEQKQYGQALQKRLDSVAKFLKVESSTFVLGVVKSQVAIKCTENSNSLVCRVTCFVKNSVQSVRPDVVFVNERKSISPPFFPDRIAESKVRSRMKQSDVVISSYVQPWQGSTKRTVVTLRAIKR